MLLTDGIIDLEMSMLSESSSTRPAETMGSELYTAHTAEADPKHHSVSDAFSITVKYMVQILSQKFGTLSDSLRPKLQSISQRVTSGHITTIRRLELELLQTGKLTLPSTELFGSFIPEVRDICDPIYDQRGSNHRTKYHRLGIALVESLLQSIDAHNAPVPDVSVSTQEQQNASDFPLDLGDDSDALADFLKDFDNGAFGGENLFISPEPVLEDIISSSNIPTGAAAEPTTSEGSIAAHNTIDPATLSRTGSDTESTQPTRKNKRPAYTPDYRSQTPLLPSESTPLATHTDFVDSPSVTEGSGPKAEANDCCDICGYRPKGDPQWFKGSMAKHKKLQHSTEPPRIYRCQYPGCTSAYKNRPDNLRQHQLEKGHFVEGETRQKRSVKRKMDAD